MQEPSHSLVKLVALLALVTIGACKEARPGREQSNDPQFAESRGLKAEPTDSLAGDSVIVRTVVRIDSIPQDHAGDARSRITCSDSGTLEVPFRDAGLTVTFEVPGAAPWLLVAGVECSDCDAQAVL